MSDNVTIQDLFIPGIAGFLPWDPSLPGVEFVEFKRVVHGLARASKSTVLGLYEAHAGNNHHTAKVRLRWSGDEVYVLGNQATTLMSFAREVPVVDFIDVDDFSCRLSDWYPGWKCPPSSLLNRMPTQDELLLLHGPDYGQVKYWWPVTVGQIVFNMFD